MLKSLLFNWTGPHKLALHMIVDEGGLSFFAEKLVRAVSMTRVVVTFHEFNEVCVGPGKKFLEDFGFSQSAHYSGLAGYCRLFLAEPGTGIVGDGVGMVPEGGQFIAIETDQVRAPTRPSTRAAKHERMSGGIRGSPPDTPLARPLPPQKMAQLLICARASSTPLLTPPSSSSSRTPPVCSRTSPTCPPPRSWPRPRCT
jgi:hypothetical protein